MMERYKDKPTLQWQQMNCTALDFADESFDVVIAKATVDAILCGEGSTANIAKFCSEVTRVLRPTGVFIIISYGVPDNRLNYIDKEDIYSWTVDTKTVCNIVIFKNCFLIFCCFISQIKHATTQL